MLAGAYALTLPRRLMPCLLASAAAILLVLGMKESASLFDLYYPAGTLLAESRNPDRHFVIEHVAWDPLARIEISRIRPPLPQNMPYPSLIGRRLSFLKRFE